MKKRNRFVMFLLTCITCGIYYLYWIVSTTNAIESELKESNGHCTSGGKTILLMIVTCGIYTFYWWYMQGQRMAQLGKEKGVKIEDKSAFYLILLFVAGLGAFINPLSLQGSINKLVDQAAPAAEEPAAPTTEA